MRVISILLSLVVSLSAAAQTIEIVPPATLDATNTGTWKVIVSNPGTQTTLPREVRLDFTPIAPLDGQVISVPPGCHAADNGRQTACVPTTLAPGESLVYEYSFRLTGPYGQVFTYATYGYGTNGPDISTTSTVAFGRAFAVTNANDSGPGSLRQVILDVNAACTVPGVPCDIVFRIDGPVPVEGWFTIRLLSPLPPVTAYASTINGASQTQHTGNTNLAGPELMLDGSLGTEWGHGLQFGGVFATVAGLAVGNFPGNGIASTGVFDTRIERCYLGMDPSGTRRAPNGLRGTQIEGGAISVTDSILGGNFRSGGWFETTTTLLIARNRIVDNGASGLYVKVMPTRYLAVAEDNLIAGNAHAGISVDRRSGGDFTRNTFEGNLGRAIDIGIDGPTLAMMPGLPGIGGIVGAPVITAVRVENGETVLEARIAPRSPFNAYLGEAVSFYASLTPRDGGVLLGTIDAVTVRGGETFTLRVPRDLRGQWVSAATFAVYVYGWDDLATGTSEVSEPRLVE
jgi:hypothetical protein